MIAWTNTPLKGHIVEVSVRKGATPAEILSVTNANGFVRSLDVFDKQVFSQDSSNYKLVSLNDLAYNPSRINVGSVALCKFPEGGAVSPMYAVVRCRKSLLPQFLLHFLKSDIGRQHIEHHCVGAVRFQLRFDDLERIEIPLPPLPEQQLIVKLLDDVNQILNLRETASKQCAAVIPSLFESIFGQNTNCTIEKLSDVCEFITKGTTPTASDIKESQGEGDVPFLRVLHIADNGTVDFLKSPSYVSRSIHEGTLRRSKVYPCDVLMNIVGPPLGKIGLVDGSHKEWNINQALAIFRAKDGLLPSYLFYALRSPKILSGIIAKAAGVRQLNLSLEQCRNIEIPLPPLSLQKKFMAKTEEIRSLMNQQATSRKKLDTLFQSLLHRAFQGEL